MVWEWNFECCYRKTSATIQNKITKPETSCRTLANYNVLVLDQRCKNSSVSFVNTKTGKEMEMSQH
jgi:hypothetical protein